MAVKDPKRDRRPEPGSRREARAEPHWLGGLIRLAEQLQRAGRTPDAIERAVAAWMQVHGQDVGHGLELLRRRGFSTGGRNSMFDHSEGQDRRPAQRPIEVTPISVPSTPAPAPDRVRLRDAHITETGETGTTARLALRAVALPQVPAAPAQDADSLHLARTDALAPSFRMGTATYQLAPSVYAMQADATDTLSAGTGPPVGEVLARIGAGRPLPEATRLRLGPTLAGLGRPVDLDHVIIHDGPDADQLCRELRANAVCVGRHIAFRTGLFRPETADGLALLAHELTHVWQQASARVAGTEGLVTDPRLEDDADRIGTLAAASSPVAPDRAAAPVTPDRASSPVAPDRAAAPVTSATQDTLMREARAFIAAAKQRPGAIFLVADRIYGYDAESRARGSWALRGPCPLAPGSWFDGGVDASVWSELAPDQVTGISGGRADDFWVVGAQHAAQQPAAPTPQLQPVSHASSSPALSQVAQPKAGPGGLHESPESETAAPTQGAGSPLPDSLRAHFEAAFGQDFSQVRIHVGSREAVALGARAFARGSEIHFAPGEFDANATPGSSGLVVLGHELTHIVQQQSGRVPVPASTDDKHTSARINADPAFEAEADLLGARAARGEDAHLPGTVQGGIGPQPTPAAPVQGSAPVQRQAGPAPAEAPVEAEDKDPAEVSAPEAKVEDDAAKVPALECKPPGVEDEAPGIDDVAPTQQWRLRQGEPWDSLRTLDDSLSPTRKKYATRGKEREKKTADGTVKWRAQDFMITDVHIAREQAAEACFGGGENGYTIAKKVDLDAKAKCDKFIKAIHEEFNSVNKDGTEKYTKKQRPDKRNKGVVGKPHRTLADQVGLFGGKGDNKGIKITNQGGVTARQQNSALPGFSQHHTGKAFDIFNTNNEWWEAREALADWVIANASVYEGQVPYDKATAGRIKEPWHIFFK